MKKELNIKELEELVSRISEFVMSTELTKEQQEYCNYAIDNLLKLEE